MKILLAPDKFKGALSAPRVAEAIAAGWTLGAPKAEFIHAPIADGGEGFCEVLKNSLDGDWIETPSVDPLGRPILCRYVWAPKTRTAAIEMSDASGLWRLHPSELAPEKANTFGTGLLIRDAIQRGAARILVGLGGSATTDAGIGMAAALGYRFLAKDGSPVEPVPAQLHCIERIHAPSPVSFPEIIAACDVENPLLGSRGTAAVFSPQKGADSNMVHFLETGLEHLSEKVAQELGTQFRNVPGAGAAGGIGYGLLSFLNARLQPGFELIANASGLRERITAADIVITAEGRIDSQTLEGKGPAGVAQWARALGKKVIAFGGSISNDPQLASQFDALVPIVDHPMELADAMNQTAELLARAAARTARLIHLLNHSSSL